MSGVDELAAVLKKLADDIPYAVLEKPARAAADIGRAAALARNLSVSISVTHTGNGYRIDAKGPGARTALRAARRHLGIP